MKRSCFALALSLAALSACEAIDRTSLHAFWTDHGRARIVRDAPPAPRLTAGELRAVLFELRGPLPALDARRVRPTLERRTSAAEPPRRRIAAADPAGEDWRTPLPAMPPVPVIDVRGPLSGLRGSVYGY